MKRKLLSNKRYSSGKEQCFSDSFRGIGKHPFILCIFTGLLLALSFPPLKFGFLSYIGLVPLFLLIDIDYSYTASVRYGLLTGIVFHLGTLYWIAWDTVPGIPIIAACTLIVVIVLSFFFIAFTLGLSVIRKRVGSWTFIAAPFIWTAIEYLRSHGILAFPWTSLGYSQSYYLPIIQFASITSVYGVSFWIVLINVLFFLWIKNSLNRKIMLCILVILFVFLLVPYWFGRRELSKKPTESDFRAAFIQGNIDPKLKWATHFRETNLKVYIEMSKSIPAEEVDLIIWPETAIPVYLSYEDELKSNIHHMVDSLRIPVLTGAPNYLYDTKADYLFYNSVFLFQPGTRELQEYSKIHLVPFSEYVPFQSYLPFLRKIRFGQADFSPGREYTLFDLGSQKFGVIICFESIFPDLVREFVKHGADFMVNITNDAWFGNTSSPYQHARIAIFRSIENRIGLARCANTGISMFIDPYGRVSKETRFNSRISQIGDIHFHEKRSFYTTHGNIFSKSCIALSILFLLITVIIGRRQ